MDRINKKLVEVWSDLPGKKGAVVDAWIGTVLAVITGAGLIGCIIQAILK